MSYPVTADVVEKLAVELDEEPTDLPPLSNSTDPDALERLIESTDRGSARFRHVGYQVTVSVTGEEYTVEVARPAGSD
jgi:hypothetical protein